jgi:hypothetical protein
MKKIETVLLPELQRGLAKLVDEVNEQVECKRHEATEVARSIAALSWKADILVGQMAELEALEKTWKQQQ